MTTALALAGLERKRILRELLACPEPWPASHRKLYTEMLFWEWQAIADHDHADAALVENIAAKGFAELVLKGVAPDQAREAAVSTAQGAVRRPSLGRKERDRRRTFREAVTAGDGALAVTTGLVATCIACDGPFPPGSRRDGAYCSDACRQTAYRKRRAAEKSLSPGERAVRDAKRQKMENERQRGEKAFRDVGLSDRHIKKYIMVANLSEAEFQEFLDYSPEYLTSKRLQAMRAAKRRQEPT